jgi:glycosyltransferase involved in cell wall biosynthesis
VRVLVVHNRYRSEFPSGENAVVDDETRLLAEHGCDVTRLELDSDSIARWSPTKRASLPFRVVWSPAGARLVHDAIERVRPDIVHVHNTFPLFSPTALRAARRSGVPVVQTLHNFRPLCASGVLAAAPHGVLECLRRGCYRGSRTATAPVAAMIAAHRALGTWRAVDKLVCASDFARDRYVDAGWPEERIAVKYNTAPDPTLRRVGAGEGFVFLGRLGPEKGVDLLLEAWRRAFAKGDETLTVIGSGESRPPSPPPGVEFVGRLPHAEALTALVRARALVVPSQSYEVFPRVVVEAYGLGVPVVASRLGALVELVEHKRTGLLVAHDKPEELAAALRNLAANPELAVRLGTQARLRYEKRYSADATTARLLEVYKEARAA